jgi:hypothetical protein
MSSGCTKRVRIAPEAGRQVLTEQAYNAARDGKTQETNGELDHTKDLFDEVNGDVNNEEPPTSQRSERGGIPQAVVRDRAGDISVPSSGSSEEYVQMPTGDRLAAMRDIMAQTWNISEKEAKEDIGKLQAHMCRMSDRKGAVSFNIESFVRKDERCKKKEEKN